MPIPFTCPHCGRQTNVPDEYAGQSGPCAGCGQTISVPRLAHGGPFAPGGAPPPSIGDDPAIRMLLPVGRSGLSIAAGYAGLFSLIPVFAPIAVLLGALAIYDLKKHPKKRGMGRAIFGLVMGIVCTLLTIVGLISLTQS
jgi:hypothetical protein